MSRKKKIALIELSRHNEVLHAYIDMFRQLDCEIYCYTNSFCQTQIQLIDTFTNVHWIIIDGKNYYDELEKIELEFDKLIFITVDPVLEQLPKKYLSIKTTLVLHDIHAYTLPTKYFHLWRQSFIQSVKNVAKWSIYILLKKQNYTKQLINSECQYALPTDETKSYFDKLTSHINNSYTLNFAVPKYKSKIHKRSFVNITIPGNISDKNRDYDLLLRAIKLLDINVDINFHFLGDNKSYYAKTIMKKIDKISRQGLKFYFYNSFIEQKQFDDILRDSDFLILPFKKTMHYQIFKERMGHSCVSGSINDMVRFSIPSLIPKFYPLDKGLDKFTEQFESAIELALHINTWITSKEYNKLKVEIDKTMPYYKATVHNNFIKYLKN